MPQDEKKLEYLKNCAVCRELVSYKDKDTGDKREFYVYYVQFGKIKVKATLNRDQLDCAEQYGLVEVE